MERKILKIGNQLLNTRSDYFKKLDLTPNQSETLLYFERNAGNLVLDLKDYLEISHQAARNLVERMKEKDLLYVTVSPKDARARQVFLTEKGKRVCGALKKRGTSVGHRILNDLTASEKKELSRLLDKIVENLQHSE